ncbi:MAG: M48 family metalloprotease [Gemmatimonadetes bacterium]|nr:M48 family metalloprotease [Gemmatimonadota bacterium]
MVDSTNRLNEATGSVSSTDDEPIRLTWRDKLVEFGLNMSVITAGMCIALLVFLSILLTADDVIERAVPGLFDHGSLTIVILIVLSATVGNVCAYLCFPYLVRYIFRGYELRDDRLDRSVGKLIASTGMDIAAENLFTIKSRTANAMVTGLFQKNRYIFFTDKLLAKVNEEEILAIFAHELAHIRHRHLPKMLLATFMWICGMQVFMYQVDFNAYFDALDESFKLWAYSIINVVNVWILMFLVLYPLSRRNEYEADATAAGWVGVECYSRALYRLHQVNESLKPPPRFAKVLLTHPTMQNRLDRVAQLNSK